MDQGREQRGVAPGGVRLRSLSARLTGDEPVPVLLQAIVDAARDVAGVRRCAIELTEPAPAGRYVAERGAVAFSGDLSGPTHERYAVPIRGLEGSPFGTLSAEWDASDPAAEHAPPLLELLARAAADLIDRRRRDEDIRRGQIILASFYDSSPLLMGLEELAGDEVINLHANAATGRFFGTGAADLQGRPWTEARAPQAVRRLWLERYRECQRLRMPVHFEYEHPLPGGGRWLRATITYLGPGETGRPLFSFVAEDVTERKRAEQALRESEETARRRAEELATLMDLVPLAIWVTRDPRCDVITGNAAANTFFEAEAGENVSAEPRPGGTHEVTRRVFQDGRELTPDLLPMHQAVATGCEIRNSELQVLLPSGRELWMLGNASPLRDAGGAIRGGVAAFLDITERRRGEEALRESEHRLREVNAQLEAMFEHSNAGLILYEAAAPYRVIAANRYFEQLWPEPYCSQGLRGVPLTEFIPDAVEAGVLAIFEDVVRTRAGRHLTDFPYNRMPGGPRWWNWTLEPVVRDGEVVALANLAIDVSDAVRAREELRTADRRKDDFLAVLSHELRNPLAPIRNSLRLLERVPPGSEQAGRALGVIARQVDQLIHIVNDLLDFNRVATGKVRLRQAPLDLADLLRRTIDDYRTLFAERDLTVDCRVPDDPILVHGDTTRLAQATGNLLHNALKFTRAGGRITVAVEVDGGEALVSVQDTGVGIEPAHLERIFDPFTQAARTLDRSKGGLGLGLALVQGITLLHGGRVGAHSDGPGKGATFTIRLPLLAAASAGAGPAERAPAPGRPRPGRRVLIIEDGADTAVSLSELLQMCGHKVAVAATGAAGIAACGQFHPDAIVCDIGLPDMDGYDVARRLREDHPRGSLLLVAVTGYGRDDDRRRALDAGFDAHLTKPVDLEALEQVLSGGGGSSTLQG